MTSTVLSWDRAFKPKTKMKIVKTPTKKVGVLVRAESFWIGLHYSKSCKRYCLNVIPCVTFWWIKPGGKPADITKM